MKCIVCEKEVNNHGDCKSNVNSFTFGYGSKFDCTKLDITICDDCTEKKIKNGTIEEYEDVLTGEKNFLI